MGSRSRKPAVTLDWGKASLSQWNWASCPWQKRNTIDTARETFPCVSSNCGILDKWGNTWSGLPWEASLYYQFSYRRTVVFRLWPVHSSKKTREKNLQSDTTHFGLSSYHCCRATTEWGAGCSNHPWSTCEDGLQVDPAKVEKVASSPHRSQHKRYNNFWALQTTIGGSSRDLQR